MIPLCYDKQLSIHTIELKCELPFGMALNLKKAFFESNRRRTGKGWRRGCMLCWSNINGGMQLKMHPQKSRYFYSVYAVINPRRLVGDNTYIGLACLDNDTLRKLEDKVKYEMNQLGFPYRYVAWYLNRIDIAFQFRTAEQKLLIKLLRNHSFVYHTQELYNQNNEMRSFYIESPRCNVQLYDKRFKMERDNCKARYSEEDWESAKGLMRLELQLHRYAIKDLQLKYNITSDSLAHELALWREHLQSILTEYIAGIFGSLPYVTQQMAYEKLDDFLKSGSIRHKTYDIACEYLDDIQDVGNVPEVCEKWMKKDPKRKVKKNKRCYQSVRRAFNKLQISHVVLPDSSVAKREICRFPIPPLPELFSIS